MPRLCFDPPLLRWTPEARHMAQQRVNNMPRQDDAWRDARVRTAIGSFAAVMLADRVGRRATARHCLHLLRRAWWAHCAGQESLCRLMFNEARWRWVDEGERPLLEAGVRAIEQTRRRKIAGAESGAKGHGMSADFLSRRDSQIRAAFAAGAATVDLAERFDLTPRRVQQILSAK
jgi:hypothetical protein